MVREQVKHYNEDKSMSSRRVLESQLAETNRELELSTFLNKGVLQSNAEFKLRIAELEQENAVLRTAESRLAKMEEKLETYERRIKELTRELRECREEREAEREDAERVRREIDRESEVMREELRLWRGIGESVGRVMLDIRDKTEERTRQKTPRGGEGRYYTRGQEAEQVWPRNSEDERRRGASRPRGIVPRDQNHRGDHATPGKQTTRAGIASTPPSLGRRVYTPRQAAGPLPIPSHPGPSRSSQIDSATKQSPSILPLSGHIRKRPRRIEDSGDEGDSADDRESESEHDEVVSPRRKQHSARATSNSNDPVRARPKRAAAQAGQAAQTAQAQLLAHTTTSGTVRRDKERDKTLLAAAQIIAPRKSEGRHANQTAQSHVHEDVWVKKEEESPRFRAPDSEDDPLLMD